jgi:hypothetical protein
MRSGSGRNSARRRRDAAACLALEETRFVAGWRVAWCWLDLVEAF